MDSNCRSRAIPRVLTGSGACSRRVTSSMRAWAAAMLARCIGTRPDRVARVSVASRTARRSARATAWRSAPELSRAAWAARALPARGAHPYRECPVESWGPQPGRQACADGWPGVAATSRVGPVGSRRVIGANVGVIHCVSSLLDSGWFEHSATWVTNRGEPMSVTVGSRAPSVQLMILIVD